MRRHYLDNIRWITVVLVVFYHVFYIYNANGIPGGPGHFREFQPQDAVQYLLYPWFMSLLFVVSGMSARYYLEKHTEREFLRARTRKLLVPSTIGLVVFQWIQGYFNMLNSNAFENIRAGIPAGSPESTYYAVVIVSMILSGSGVLWTIQMLWLYSALLLLIRKVEKGRLLALCGGIPLWGVLLLGVPFWGAAQILNMPTVTVYKFGAYGFAFFAGYFVFSHDGTIEKLAKYALPFVLAASVLGVLFVCFCFGTNYAEKPVFSSPLSIAFAWATILAVLGGMKRWGDRTGPFAAWMAKRSFGLYVFHFLGISASAYYLYQLWLTTGFSPLLIYVLTGVAGYAAGFLLYALISRIPVLRWCVLGIRKR